MKDNFITETSIRIDASPAQFWKALTTPKPIKKYLMGTDVSSDWKEGAPIYNTIVEGEYDTIGSTEGAH